MKQKLVPFLKLAPKSAKDISAIGDAALRAANLELKKMLSVRKGEKRTKENTLDPLNRIAIALAGASNQAEIFSLVHPDAKFRKAAEAVTQKVSKFITHLYLRRDVYEALAAVSPFGLDPSAKRFREKELLDFKLSGVDRPAAVRAELKKLSAQAIKLGQAFDRNIKDDVRVVSLSPDDLDGLPDDYRKAHAPDKHGRVSISTQYPDYFPFMRYAKNPAARKKMSFAFNNRAWPKNDSVFVELLRTRERTALLLGFKDFADYATVTKMTKSADAVQKFLDQVTKLTSAGATKEYRDLLARKRKDEPGAKQVFPWEYAYYDTLVAQESAGIDSQEMRNYFDFKNVKACVLESTQKLFGLTYRRVKAPVWHHDVEVYDMYRASQLIGRFQLDLHPREGKYGHACCCQARPGILDVQLPEAALICNFPDGLMDHREVEVFFHEFGHLIHNILGGHQTWARFSGVATEWDFVEAPSQMLESWTLDYETLKKFAIHAKTGKPITKTILEKLRIAEDFGKGTAWRRQTFLALLSLVYHRKKKIKVNDLLSTYKTNNKIYSLFGYQEGTHMYASFGHLSSYSAIYYTYIWSRAIAEDILGPFKKHGMYDKKTAQKYRDLILAPGGSKDARELLRDFLGREWNLNSFKTWLQG